MISFKSFLFNESVIDKKNLRDAIKRFSEIKIGEVELDYYLKAGSPVFALALYYLINKQGELFKLADEEMDFLHVVVKIDNDYWDVNGGNTLKRKEEFITTIGNTEWKKTTFDDVVKHVESIKKVTETHGLLKNILKDVENEVI